jgi:hypothetical protein
MKTKHRDAEGARGKREDGGAVRAAMDQHGEVLDVKAEAGHGGGKGSASEDPGI